MREVALKRISDIISVEEINKWKVNDVITISAKTGTGKSYFIKNILSSYAKENYNITLLSIEDIPKLKLKKCA